MRNNTKRICRLIGVCLLAILSFLACCGTQGGTEETVKTESSLIPGGSMELKYATQFAVDYYEDCTLVTIHGQNRYLVVPEGEEPSQETIREISQKGTGDFFVLRRPLNHIYLVSTSTMDFFVQLEGLDNIRLSGTRANGWYLDEAVSYMEEDKILYAGKYSAPDYELILDEGCDLALENTMIFHNPEVKEQLENLGIPVLVEYSSYEPNPLGRLEWIRLYGVLLGKEEQADSLFENWLLDLEPVLNQEKTGQTVAFFYITKNKTANIRKPNDYLAQMIAMAGGEYIFDDIAQEEENALSTMNIDMEAFYQKAKDADYLIYNCTIDDELHSLEELLDKSPLLSDFKAVQEGNVYCTGKNFFQETTGMGQFILELHGILEDSGDEGVFLRRLQ